MKSSTAYKISKIFYDPPTELTDAEWRKIDAVFESDIDEIVSSIDLFLTELNKRYRILAELNKDARVPEHELPGKVFDQLQDRARQAKRTGTLSQRQQRYITMALIGYWDQTDLEFI